MTLPVWPSVLPQRVLRDGYSEQKKDGRAFTATSAGPGKTRRRYSSTVKSVACGVVVSYEGKAYLEQFVEEEILDGAKPFLIPDQTHDDVPFSDELSDILVDENGDLLTNTGNWLVMFDKDQLPKYEPYGIQFKATFTLLVLP
jgi:hypothetical protein